MPDRRNNPSTGFLARSLTGGLNGVPFSRYRQALTFLPRGLAVEQIACRGLVPQRVTPAVRCADLALVTRLSGCLHADKWCHWRLPRAGGREVAMHANSLYNVLSRRDICFTPVGGLHDPDFPKSQRDPRRGSFRDYGIWSLAIARSSTLDMQPKVARQPTSATCGCTSSGALADRLPCARLG